MNKDIIEFTKEDFEEVKMINDYSNIEFDSFVIIPSENLHESGFRNMGFVLIRYGEIVGKIGGSSDAIHILTKKNINIDMLPCGYLRIFSSDKVFFIEGHVLSDFYIYGG